MRFYYIILFAVVMVFTGCSRGPAKISVTNASSISLSNVWVSGEHFSQSLGLMSPGMSASFTLTSGSETKVWLNFEAEAQKVDSRGSRFSDYFEVSSGHPLSLTVGADLKVVPSRTTGKR